jgi:hypothetical protein
MNRRRRSGASLYHQAAGCADDSALERELAAVQPVAPPPRPKSPPDMDFYITIAENAKKRVEALERENLDVSLVLRFVHGLICPAASAA